MDDSHSPDSSYHRGDDFLAEPSYRGISSSNVDAQPAIDPIPRQGQADDKCGDPSLFRVFSSPCRMKKIFSSVEPAGRLPDDHPLVGQDLRLLVLQPQLEKGGFPRPCVP